MVCSRAVIRVGAVLSLHGHFAPQGRQAHAGLALWADAVNAAGGLAVRDHGGQWPIELIVYDDESRAGPATSWTEHLILTDRVNLLVGPYSSTLTLVVAAVAERHRKVLWNHGGASDAVARQGFRFVVSLPSPASQYFVSVLELVRTVVPDARRLVLLQGVGGTFAATVIAGAAAYAHQHGLQIILHAPYPSTPAGFAGLGARVAACKPDLILGVGRTEADLQFARACRAQQVGTRLIGLVATPLHVFKQTLGREADGFVGPSQWEPGVRYQPDIGPTPAAFAARFRDRYHIEPEYPAVQAYAAGLVAQHCINVAGTLQDEALRECAHRLALTTLYGAFKLDPVTSVQRGHRLVVVQWQGEQKPIVWPAAGAAAPLYILPPP